MSSPAPHAHTLQCTEYNCVLPVGEIVDGALVIRVRHHGKKHKATIPLVDILRLISTSLDIKSLTNADNLVIPSPEGSNPNHV